MGKDRKLSISAGWPGHAFGRAIRLAQWMFALLFSVSVQAETVGIQFKEIKVAPLVESVVRGVLERDYIIAPEILRMDSSVTLSVKAVERGKVLDLLRSSLVGVGVAVIERDGILYIEPMAKNNEPRTASVMATDRSIPWESQERTKEVDYYFPRFKPAELLMMAARAAGATVPEIQGVKEGGNKRDVVIYSGSPELIAKVGKLLADIDRPSPSIHVRAAVVEVTEHSENSRSINAVFNLLRGKLGLTLAAGAEQVNSLAISGKSLGAVLSAVDGDSRFKYLSEPSLRVVDGETAKLVIGSDVPVRGQTVVSNGQSIQGIEYRTAGVVVTLEPRILRDSILLKINQQVSSFSNTTTSGIDSPTMQKREAQTVIDAREGEVIVIAGMDESRDSETHSGLSWLPSWLGSRNASATRSHVLLMLEVMRNPLPSI